MITDLSPNAELGQSITVHVKRTGSSNSLVPRILLEVERLLAFEVR